MAKERPIRLKPVKAQKDKKDIFDLSLVDEVDIGCATKNKYYDKFTANKTRLVKRLVDMSCDDFLRLAYSQSGIDNEKVKNEKLDLSTLEVPIIDIVSKTSSGRGRVLVARSRGYKKIPVLILAGKDGALDWYLERKGIKNA